MKSLLFIIAIVFGATTTTVQASNFITNNNSNPIAVSVNKPQVNLLCTSIAKGDTAVVKRLIQNGSDVNKKSNGLTPAMYAAKYNRVAILEILISEGADLKIKCDKGYTALDYAEATNATAAQEMIEDTLAQKKANR
ncbi:ankyrin repeat domain-containing protein [Formosa sp. PL04]|uniref:ankyrin repeat domain-containing protein n=1 Tax=Formosa sp. PL04 TaxID=3081755 RepID=UPI0029813EDE|nr:ankyrin repeat domain-containing protein [Formosa sp. PL04]MDW5287819.1 ankyrin repeat domain-containing protein [Formosa sp. PL04]